MWKIDTLEYSRVKATSVSVRLLIFLFAFKIPNKNHLVVQERSKSLERIEIWEISFENPSLVEFHESSVHPPLSSAMFGSSESSLLPTLGDRYHLDGSVVIGGTKTARSSCGWLVSSLWAVLGDSPRRGLVESGDSLIPRQNITEHFLPLLLYFLAFTLCLYILRIAMLE